ncbi:uncharacterized protein V6R79_022722 [Siganus canaliculatus]
MRQKEEEEEEEEETFCRALLSSPETPAFEYEECPEHFLSRGENPDSPELEF